MIAAKFQRFNHHVSVVYLGYAEAQLAARATLHNWRFTFSIWSQSRDSRTRKSEENDRDVTSVPSTLSSGRHINAALN